MKTKCPHCHVKFSTRDEHKDKKVKCPKCSELFVISPLAESTVNTCGECSRLIDELGQACVLGGRTLCKECEEELREGSSGSVNVKKALLIWSFIAVLVVGICFAFYFFLIIGPPFRPTGFSVTDRLPSTSLRRGRLPGSYIKGEYVPPDPNKRFLTVYGTIRSGCLIPRKTDDKYQETIDNYLGNSNPQKEKLKALPVRDHTRFYDPAKFRLILSNKETYHGELIAQCKEGSIANDGFVPSWVTESFESPVPKNKRETIAVVWVLDTEYCVPPFKISFRNSRAIGVSNEQLPAPRGR